MRTWLWHGMAVHGPIWLYGHGMIYGPKSPENAPKMNPYSLNTDSADSLIPFIPESPYLLILLSLYPLTPFSPIPLFPYPISLQLDLGHGIFNTTTFLSPYPLYPLTPLSAYPRNK